MRHVPDRFIVAIHKNGRCYSNHSTVVNCSRDVNPNVRGSDLRRNYTHSVLNGGCHVEVHYMASRVPSMASCFLRLISRTSCNLSVCLTSEEVRVGRRERCWWWPGGRELEAELEERRRCYPLLSSSCGFTCVSIRSGRLCRYA